MHMQEETALSALSQLDNMTPNDIRTRLAGVLMAGEVLSDEDCEHIRAHAEVELEANPGLSIDDVFVGAAAVRLEIHNAKGQYASVNEDSVVVAYGSDPKLTAEEGHKNLSGI